MAQLTDAVKIQALARAIPEKTLKTSRELLKPGKYIVDEVVRIKGELVVGEDTDKASTVSIPHKRTLALFVKYSGITGQHALDLLSKCMQEAWETEKKGDEVLAEETDGLLVEATKKVEAMIGTLPRTPVKGAVKAHLKVDEITSAPLSTVGELMGDAPTASDTEAYYKK